MVAAAFVKEAGDEMPEVLAWISGGSEIADNDANGGIGAISDSLLEKMAAQVALTFAQLEVQQMKYNAAQGFEIPRQCDKTSKAGLAYIDIEI